MSEDGRKEWTYFDRTGWPDGGPWCNEPDKVEWRDEATGLPCIARRGGGGAWCGYVGVSETHPCFGRDDAKVEVHGGITFAAPCDEHNKEHGICHVPLPGEPDRVWWLGFDCCHYGDLRPGDLVVHEVIVWTHHEIYRDLEYVRRQCAKLAKQLSEIRQ